MVQSEHLVDHQIPVEVVNQNGQLSLCFPDGQQMTWPVVDAALPPGTYYLVLSPQQLLPTKAELAKVVLQEILKVDQ